MKRSYKQVTQKEFELTKQLALAGLKASKIKIVTGRSTVSIGRMLRAESLADYHKKQVEDRARYTKNGVSSDKPVDEMPVSVLDTDVSINVPELLRKVAAYLERNTNVE